ncbi:NRAMP family divalent metal transporter [Ilyobacter sp.]|uniref:NRAMP family divalent metal transporter n=1 Tax=Ilyobacter sp. TaxID=3100343 RepID=UPI00356245D9
MNKQIVLEESKKSNNGVIMGAAFLMATSAVGPGFLTQTAVFTEKFRGNFALPIIISIFITLVVQLNIWKIIGVSEMRGQDIANKILPGLGHFIAVLVSLGGLAFNIGNVGGAALGFNVLFGTNLTFGALFAGIIGSVLFISKDAGKIMDKFAKVLGIIMIAVIAYMAIVTRPPVVELATKVFNPENPRQLFFPLITLLGGTIGGYITFAGGHRLIDAGIKGEKSLDDINKSSLIGVSLASIIRVLMFLAILGVVTKGGILDPLNPPASAFKLGAGMIGYKIFGIVILAASLTSIVGAAYTSVSFLKTLSPVINRNEKNFIVGFIMFSSVVMAIIGKPVKLLILAGSLNGLILPLTLLTILLAVFRKDIVGTYKHPKWLVYSGMIVVLFMSIAAFGSLKNIVKIF